MQYIPLTSLLISKSHNVRKTDREGRLEELVASIRTLGLLENLIVIPANNGDKFEVIAGGRRLRALQLLAKEGALPNDYTVPCEVADISKAHEISLAENIVRVPMHPADQFEAWAKLIDQGMTAADIAARFGVADKQVEQRLKLGKVSPKLMKAYRNNAFSLEVLMAFTLSDEHQKQEELYKRIKGSWEINQPHAIRRALTDTTLSSKNKCAKFVGLEVYVNAGGTLCRDLFSEDNECFLENPILLQKLTEEKLQQHVAKLQGEWKWVEARLEFGWDEKAKYSCLTPHPLTPIPEEWINQQAELQQQYDNLAIDDEEGAKSISNALDAVEEKITALNGFDENDRATSGCIVSISHNGELCIYEGFIRPEDKDTKIDHASEEENAGCIIPQEIAQPYSKVLTERLKNYRLHVVRQYMFQDYETAFDAMLYNMCMRSLNHKKDWMRAGVEKYILPQYLTSDDETGSTLHQIEEKSFADLPLLWRHIEDEAERFNAFCSLEQVQKQQLFAAYMATALQPQLSYEKDHSASFEVVSNRLGVDMAQYWRPNKDNFLCHIAKKNLLAIGQEIFGKGWVKQHSQKPKALLVSILNNAFSDPTQKRFTVEEKSKLQSWLPEGMACLS